MIVEHAPLTISAGKEEEFEESIRSALPIIESAPGCHGAEVRREVERPDHYLLLVQWETVEDHMVFRSSPAFETWRALTHPFYATPPEVTHFSEALSR